MEAVIAILSWVVTILLPLLILSVPTSLVLSKVKDGWKGSKAEKLYKNIQLGALGLWILSTMIVIIIMLM
jgi:hypothetical protein